MTIDERELPELSDARIDEIEGAIFTRIADDRAATAERAQRTAVRSRRTGRVWMGLAGAAAVVAVAAIVAPQLALVSGSAGGAADSASSAVQWDGALRDGAVTVPEGAESADLGGAESLTGVAASGAVATDESGTTADREIIATASATVTVDDPRAAAEQIAGAATAAGGYVEAMSIDGGAPEADPGIDAGADPAAVDGVWLPAGRSWVTVRVPADQLTAALAGLAEVGEVTGSQVDRRDVTTEAVDLRARVTALEASVARLTELMGDAASTADLLAAESALAQRQSELDSLRQQLTWLESQVGMSTLTVSLVEEPPAVEADPAGFTDGLAAGWNGLVASLNGVVVGLGFLLPWIVVAAVVGAVVFGIRAIVRRRRAPRDPSEPGDPS